jgi:hypothetical protein
VSPGDPTSHLERLPGVLVATLFLDTPAPARVYAAIAPDADGAALRGAMVGLLRDHGYHVEPDHVHLGVAPASAPAGDGVLPRTNLDAVDVSRRANRVECTVRLRSGRRLLKGDAAEPDTPSGRARAAARATLQAAESLDPDYRFGLEGVRSLELFGADGLVLVVEAGAGRIQARLAGVALVERSVEEAAALAALQALRGWRL